MSASVPSFVALVDDEAPDRTVLRVRAAVAP
jgi:hypothetical protein